MPIRKHWSSSLFPIILLFFPSTFEDAIGRSTMDGADAELVKLGINNGDQWPLALLDGDQLPTLMDAEEIDGDEASWEQYLLEMKTYKDYMRAMLPKAEQKTHDKYKFSLEELDANDNLDEEDKAAVRRFLHGIKLQPHPPTCAPPLGALQPECDACSPKGVPNPIERHLRCKRVAAESTHVRNVRPRLSVD
jgi:hypothetical protein